MKLKINKKPVTTAARKVKLSAITIVLLAFANLSVAQVKFDPAKPDTTEKMVKKLINAKLDDLKKNKVKKVIITGCKGEFLLSKTTAPGAWEGKDMLYYEKKQKTTTQETNIVNQEYCVELTSRLYDSVVSLFKSAGIEVVDMETWQKSPVYQEMQQIMLDSDKDQATKYGMIKPTVTIRTLTVPAYGLKLEPENVLKMIKYTQYKTQKMGKVLEENDAQAFCNISFKMDVSIPKPTLMGMGLIFETGLKKYDMGGKDKDGNKNYMYSLATLPSISLKDILEYQGNVYEDKYLSVKLTGNAVLEMQTYVLSMFRGIIKNTAAQY